jgi:hypothetical protein
VGENVYLAIPKSEIACSSLCHHVSFPRILKMAFVFDGNPFLVPNKSLFELFEHNRDLFEATCHAAQSSVPLDVRTRVLA